MTLTRPTLSDLLHICSHLEHDQVLEHSALAYGEIDPKALAAHLHTAPIAHVFRSGSVPYMAAGFTFPIPGVAQSWAVSTNERLGHDLSVTRTCRIVIERLLEGSIHRIQTVCLASRVKAMQWYALLGLTKEADLAQYGRHGEDFCLFRRLRDV